MTIHPHVTIGAILTGLASTLVNVVPSVVPLIASHFGVHAGTVNAAASAVTAVATIVAGLGTSPMKAPAPPPVQKEVPHIMATTFLGAVADEAVATLETADATTYVEGLIATGETSLEALVAKGIAALPKPSNPFVAMLLPEAESAAETYAAAIVAKYPKETIYGWLLDLAKEIATKLGG